MLVARRGPLSFWGSDGAGFSRDLLGIGMGSQQSRTNQFACQHEKGKPPRDSDATLCEKHRMCARKSWHQPAGESPVRGNRDEARTASGCARPRLSRYRVLRAARSRGRPRSVDRECAGHNASCVKGSSPVKRSVPWWPSVYAAAKAASAVFSTVGTTGVLDHGMYTRLMSEAGRSPRGGAHPSQCSSAAEQGGFAKFAVSARGEVRSGHSSEEVG